VDDSKTDRERVLDVAGLVFPPLAVARGGAATVTGHVHTDYLVPGLGAIAVVVDEAPRLGFKGTETIDHISKREWKDAARSAIDAAVHAQNIAFSLFPFLTEAARTPQAAARNESVDAKTTTGPTANSTPMPDGTGPTPSTDLQPTSEPVGAKEGFTGQFRTFKAADFRVTSELETKVNTLHELLKDDHQIAFDRKTTALGVAETRDGLKLVVGSSDSKIPEAIRVEAARQGILFAEGKGHAEKTVIEYVKRNEWTLKALAPSRDFCLNCWLHTLESRAVIHGTLNDRALKK
jgi:hypothetical protein